MGKAEQTNLTFLETALDVSPVGSTMLIKNEALATLPERNNRHICLFYYANQGIILVNLIQRLKKKFSQIF